MIHLPPYLIYLGYRAAREYLRRHGGTAAFRDQPSGPSAAGQGAAGLNSQRIKDLATLGLDEGATLTQIEDAFRRLAGIHHPDRFAGQSPEVLERQTKAFLLIRAARDRLMGDAA